MGKYIDVDKLKVLLSDLKENHKQYRGDFHEGVVFAVDEILDDIEESIESLQAEQSSLPDNLDEAAFEYENTLWEDGCKDCGYSPLEVFDAFKAGAEWMAKQMKQEQPELPDNLDEAAEEFYKEIEYYPLSLPLYNKHVIQAFKAGAEWVAKQNTHSDVDFDDSIENYIKENFGEPWDGCVPVGFFELSQMARHFYELGFNARKEE